MSTPLARVVPLGSEEEKNKNIIEEMNSVYDSFQSKLKQLEEERDKKIFSIIEKIDKKQIDDVRNNLSS